jgi:hypothetical protein
MSRSAGYTKLYFNRTWNQVEACGDKFHSKDSTSSTLKLKENEIRQLMMRLEIAL